MLLSTLFLLNINKTLEDSSIHCYAKCNMVDVASIVQVFLWKALMISVETVLILSSYGINETRFYPEANLHVNLKISENIKNSVILP